MTTKNTFISVLLLLVLLIAGLQAGKIRNLQDDLTSSSLTCCPIFKGSFPTSLGYDDIKDYLLSLIEQQIDAVEMVTRLKLLPNGIGYEILARCRQLNDI
jgi:hypothetical protein